MCVCGGVVSNLLMCVLTAFEAHGMEFSAGRRTRLVGIDRLIAYRAFFLDWSFERHGACCSNYLQNLTTITYPVKQIHLEN